MNQSLRFAIVILPILVLAFFAKVLLVDDDIEFSNFESKNFPSFELNDLNSRAKNIILSKIDKPEDDLLYALILKNLSARQISIDKKLIDFIIKRIDRSYGKISEFIYKIDEISLKRKKPIDFKIIKEVLGD